jgi:pSer/pThr/pTyr-binding forkhead associated (FHA) protein
MEVTAFAALVLHLDGISRVHAAVLQHKDKAFVTDLGSTNGTRIFRDQQAIEVKGEPIQLHGGDVLWIGAVFFHVLET